MLFTWKRKAVGFFKYNLLLKQRLLRVLVQKYRKNFSETNNLFNFQRFIMRYFLIAYVINPYLTYQ